MKQVLFTVAMLLLSSSVFSQSDCTKNLKTENYSGKTMTSLKESIVVTQSPGESIDINLIFGSNLMMNITSLSKEIRCVGTKANMDVYFADTTKLSFAHMGNMNCTGSFSVFFGEVFQNANEMEQLKTKEIAMLSITYTDVVDGVVKTYLKEFLFSDEQAKTFANAFNCLYNLNK